MKVTFDDRLDKLTITLSKANMGRLVFFEKHWNGRGPISPGIVWRKGSVEITVELEGKPEEGEANV